MDTINFDETGVGKFLYNIVKYAMTTGKPITREEINEQAYNAGLLTQNIYEYLQDPKNKKLSTDEYKLLDTRESLINILMGQIANNALYSDNTYKSTIKPEYYFNIVDVDEFRFATQQAQDAQKTAQTSLNWTRISFAASIFFSLASIIISVYIPFYHNKAIQNTVSIESKQVDSLQGYINQSNKQYQTKLDLLVTKLDSLIKLNSKRK